METVLVGLKNEKAKKLLKDLEDLNLIELLDKEQKQTNKKLSALKDAIALKMNESEINDQFNIIRNEWQRDI
ncbi:MAG TPA: hypothetical protein VFW07_08405 [Parafilimonas sp.]|nr:hypothetical protein [Parafilimonas sp.]